MSTKNESQLINLIICRQLLNYLDSFPRERVNGKNFPEKEKLFQNHCDTLAL